MTNVNRKMTRLQVSILKIYNKMYQFNSDLWILRDKRDDLRYNLENVEFESVESIAETEINLEKVKLEIDFCKAKVSVSIWFLKYFKVTEEQRLAEMENRWASHIVDLMTEVPDEAVDEDVELLEQLGF